MANAIFNLLGSSGTDGVEGKAPDKNSNGQNAQQGTPDKNSCSIGLSNATKGVDGVRGVDGGTATGGSITSQGIFELGEISGTVTIKLFPAKGGDGADGTDGGAGGNGGDGAKVKEAEGGKFACPALPKGKGGDGGDGGNGSNGANGGDCPDILITYTGPSAPSVVFPDNAEQKQLFSGGKGGRNGSSGAVGTGSPNGSLGRSGTVGDAGHPGKFKTYTIRQV
jgi:hypothetical protein